MGWQRTEIDAGWSDALERLLRLHDIDTADENRFAQAHALIDELPARLHSVLGNQRQLISPDATIHDTAILGDDIVVFPGAYIGPYCYLRSSTVVYPGAYLGYLVETNVCVLFDNVQVHHAAVICQSIVGSGSNLAFGFATTTRKVDRKPVRYPDGSGGLVICNASHHGSVLGQKVIAGAHVLLMPGASVGPGVTLLPQKCFHGIVRTNPVDSPK